MTTVELKINGVYTNLSKGEKRAADYMSKNIPNILKMSLCELSADAEVNQATMVRLCKSLGYTGFKELKKSIITEFNSVTFDSYDSIEQYTDIKDKSNLKSIKEYISSNAVKAIEDTMKLLDEESIEQVAQYIINANTIKIFGMGVSGLVGEDLCYKLIRIGKNVCHNRDFHIQLMYASTMKKGDVAVLISYSGMTSELLELMNIVKKTGAITVAITKYAKNEFTGLADYVLHTSTPEIDKRSGAMSSRIAQLCIVDVLFTSIANKDYSNITSNLKRSYESCIPHKKK